MQRNLSSAGTLSPQSQDVFPDALVHSGDMPSEDIGLILHI